MYGHVRVCSQLKRRPINGETPGHGRVVTAGCMSRAMQEMRESKPRSGRLVGITRRIQGDRMARTEVGSARFYGYTR